MITQTEPTGAYAVEYTDTFGGEANYCWVRRATVRAPDDASQAAIMRRAKAAVGLTGVRGRVTNYGDTIEFRPFRMATVMFVNYCEHDLPDGEDDVFSEAGE